MELYECTMGTLVYRSSDEFHNDDKDRHIGMVVGIGNTASFLSSACQEMEEFAAPIIQWANGETGPTEARYLLPLEHKKNETEIKVENFEEMVEAIKEIRHLICAAAEEGFNPLMGDWAEKLFLTNARTHRLLKNIGEEE